jgi:hypothetical protein
MKIKIKLVLFSIGIFLVLFSCKNSEELKPNPTPSPVADFSCPANYVAKEDRLLGMDMLSQNETSTFGEDYILAKGAGVTVLHLALNWSSIEGAGVGTTSGALNGQTLQTMNEFCAANSCKIALVLRPVDASGLYLPSDLASTRFNSNTMKTRFKKLIDFVVTKIPLSRLNTLMVGNELDMFDVSKYSATNAFWNDYSDFLFWIHNHIDTNYSGLKMGYVITLNGAIESDPASPNQQGVFLAWNGNVDQLGITYYPMEDIVVKDPAVVSDDFSALLLRYPSIPVYVTEAGYPSALTNNSNETKQAEFICNLFQSWDTHRDRIKTIAFLRLNDVSRSDAVILATPYNVSGPQYERFVDYLETLGLRHYGAKGTDKMAFKTMKVQANLRGF